MQAAVPRRGIPGVALVASVLVIALVVNAAVVANQPAALTPQVRTPLPVTMTSLNGATTVTSSTVASTVNLPVVSLVAISLIDLDRASPLDWNVELVVTAASGITAGETLRITIAGDTSQSITLTPSSTFPVAATPVVLDADGATISAAATTLSLCADCAVTAELRLTSVSPASAGLLFVYPVTIDTL